MVKGAWKDCASAVEQLSTFGRDRAGIDLNGGESTLNKTDDVYPSRCKSAIVQTFFVESKHLILQELSRTKASLRQSRSALCLSLSG